MYKLELIQNVRKTADDSSNSNYPRQASFPHLFICSPLFDCTAMQSEVLTEKAIGIVTSLTPGRLTQAIPILMYNRLPSMRKCTSMLKRQDR